MSARIYGTVKDAANGTMITNATVTAPPYPVTNTNGAYWFLTPGASSVDITASAPNYTPQTKNVVVVDGQLKNVNFTLNHV